MDTPGRTSAAALSIAPVAPWARLEPPPTLTEVEAQVWREIVATKPSEWFKADSAPVLEAYCQAIIAYRRTAAALNESDSCDLQTYKTLSELAIKQANLMAGLATKLRLTPQSRYTPQAASTAERKAGAMVGKPWEKR